MDDDFGAASAGRRDDNVPTRGREDESRKVSFEQNTYVETKCINSISRYWPDEADPIMNLGNGITLELVSKSYQGTYFTR